MKRKKSIGRQKTTRAQKQIGIQKSKRKVRKSMVQIDGSKKTGPK